MTRKEKILSFMNNEMKLPMTSSELSVVLGVPKGDMDEFLTLLEELVNEEKIVKTKKKRYATHALLGVVVGKFIGNERGFGFVEQQDKEDIFIPADSVGDALHGDIVMAKITIKSAEGKRCEGEIVKIVTPYDHRIVGRFYKGLEGGFVVPVFRRYSSEIIIENGNTLNAKDNDMVIVKLLDRKKRGTGHTGEVISVIGNLNTPGVDILSVIESRNIPYEFDDNVLNEAKKVAKNVSDKDIENRLDLRCEKIITIDGDYAKDLDDAVHVKILKNGNFELGVHIADVGNYVPYKSIIDLEAYKRGTSIYLADRVIPMLPEILSNGICSLNEGEERLTLSVIMEIDNNGNVIDHKISESVICSSKRMTYTEVTALLEGDNKRRERLSEFTTMLEDMAKLRDILRRKRVSRGSIDFNFNEARIVLDKDGTPIDIVKQERGISNSIIEEFMLVCNETVAEEMFWLNIPFIYRIHEEPAEDTVKEFAKFITPLGYRLKHSNGKIHSGEFAELIRKISGKREEMLISTAALRSLMKACYSKENVGHFGLASKYYCHFTSPIRRYPDLVIHRIIKDFINNRLNVDKMEAFVQKAANQSSDRELEAVDIERTIEDMKKAEYMQNHIGEVYKAIITSVTQFGMYAALENTIEGLIRMADLSDDYYIYDDVNMSIYGERSHKRYTVGDEIEIRVAKADPETGKIDFVLNEEASGLKPRAKKHLQQKNARTKRISKTNTAKYLRKRRKKR